jgi:hypothetical protein
MKGYAVLSFLAFTCSVMSACLASTEPPDEADLKGARTDRIGSAAQGLDDPPAPQPPAGCPIDGPEPCDSNGDPDTEPGGTPPNRCPLKWFCDGASQMYNSPTACRAACTGTCATDFICDGHCYCP